MKFWKIYIFIYISLFLLQIANTIYEAELALDEAIDLIIITPATVLALYGLISNKPFFKVYVWKILFFIQIIYVVGYLYLTSTLAEFGMQFFMLNLPILLTYLLLLAPSIFGTYKYAFKLNEIWK